MVFNWNIFLRYYFNACGGARSTDIHTYLVCCLLKLTLLQSRVWKKSVIAYLWGLLATMLLTTIEIVFEAKTWIFPKKYIKKGDEKVATFYPFCLFVLFVARSNVEMQPCWWLKMCTNPESARKDKYKQQSRKDTRTF